MKSEFVSLGELNPMDVFSIGEEKFLVIKNTCVPAVYYKDEHYEVLGSSMLTYYNNDGQECAVICLKDLTMVPPTSLKKYKVVLAGKFTGFNYNKLETEQIYE
jgi:hypothetical protein